MFFCGTDLNTGGSFRSSQYEISGVGSSLQWKTVNMAKQDVIGVGS